MQSHSGKAKARKTSIALLPAGNQINNWSPKGAWLRDLTGLNLLSYVHEQADDRAETARRSTRIGVLTQKQLL